MVKALILGLFLAAMMCGFACAAPALAITSSPEPPLQPPIDDPAARSERSTNLSHVTGAARKIQMFIKNRHLQILVDGTVNGTTDDSSPYTILQRTTVGIGQMKIQGIATCQYLCMDSCGLLYGSREFGDECIFNETIEQHHYNTYSSSKYSNDKRTLYLALNRRGQPRKVMLRARQQLGRLSSYTRVLTRTVAPERAEELHPVRHHGHSCTVIDGNNRLIQNSERHTDGQRCRKRKKRKKKKRKCAQDVENDNELCNNDHNNNNNNNTNSNNNNNNNSNNKRQNSANHRKLQQNRLMKKCDNEDSEECQRDNNNNKNKTKHNNNNHPNNNNNNNNNNHNNNNNNNHNNHNNNNNNSNNNNNNNNKRKKNKLNSSDRPQTPKKKKPKKQLKKRLMITTTEITPFESTTTTTTADEDYGIDTTTHWDWEDSTAIPDVSMSVSGAPTRIPD